MKEKQINKVDSSDVKVNEIMALMYYVKVKTVKCDLFDSLYLKWRIPRTLLHQKPYNKFQASYFSLVLIDNDTYKWRDYD